MFDREKAIERLSARQDLRRSNGLPALDMEKELASMEAQHNTDVRVSEYNQWIATNPEIVAEVRQTVLESLRVLWSKDDLDWQPSGMLSGGGMWYEKSVQEELMRRFEGR